jgi:hypothetical protein
MGGSGRKVADDDATRAASSRGDEDIRGFKQSAKRRESKAEGNVIRERGGGDMSVLAADPA